MLGIYFVEGKYQVQTLGIYEAVGLASPIATLPAGYERAAAALATDATSVVRGGQRGRQAAEWLARAALGAAGLLLADARRRANARRRVG